MSSSETKIISRILQQGLACTLLEEALRRQQEQIQRLRETVQRLEAAVHT